MVSRFISSQESIILSPILSDKQKEMACRKIRPNLKDSYFQSPSTAYFSFLDQTSTGIADSSYY